jgi:N-acetylglutamate synthase-like GNAT family acetyltransferase
MPADAESIESLYAELVHDSAVKVLPERIGQIIRDPNTRLLVAEIDDIVCGTALLALCNDVMYRDQPFGVVENIVVSSMVRRVGVGRLLMAQIEAIALETRCSKIMILSSSSRTQAHCFFESMGFDSGAKLGFVKYRKSFSRALAELQDTPSGVL